jgi:cytoskeletal protein CcmA (bactofilin family)
MVVSDSRLVQDSQARETTVGSASVHRRWIPFTIRAVIDYVHRILQLQAATAYRPARRSTPAIVKRTTAQRLALLERSSMMFRRENPGESFDDDVAALRDRVGSGQRDQSDQSQDSSDDQTTYSPPRQTWSAVTQASETGLDPSAPQQPAWQPADTGNASVVAADTSWDGNVQSSGSLHVHGNVSGQIRVQGDVFVAEGATVNADVNAGGVTVAGTLEGTVDCSGRFEVLPSGRVSANVAAPRLVVHEGAQVIGKLRMTSGG